MIRVYKNLQFFKSKFSVCKIFREKESVMRSNQRINFFDLYFLPLFYSQSEITYFLRSYLITLPRNEIADQLERSISTIVLYIFFL